ncbi:MAG TPA: DNA polymerase III subunit gamma/tau [Dehalococcoidia bacterium]|nr:DNA polymerase III subunit gamma/tau [Dehalococcoidia bacterium]
MASQVFYRKYRPQTLAEVVGQEPVTHTLLNALSSGHISHAYLFCGPRGTGKTSTARCLAKAVNCLTDGQGEPCNACEMCQAITESRALDVIEIDAASNTGVDDIRSLREKVNYAPNQARYKVYIIDEVHMLSTSASNALLKTLEEPPSHVIFILATTEAHKILATIMSRCQRFDFRRLSQADIVSKLNHICDTEGISIEPEAIRLIARSATGSQRDAENLLEQLTTYYGSDITLHQTQEMLGITGDQRTKELARHIVNSDVPAGIATINAINNDGLNLRQFNRELVEYLRGLLLIKTGAEEAVDLTAEDTAEMKELASRAPLPQLLKAVKTFGQLDLSLDSHSTLPLELAMVDCSLTPVPERQANPAQQAEYEPPQPPKKVAREPASTPAPATTPTASTPTPSQPAPEPATTEEAQPETPDASPQTFGDETEKLRQDWKRLIAEAPPEIRRTPALAILRSAGITPVSVENGTVILSSRYPYLKEKLEDPENQRVVEAAISSFLGHPCRVRCVSEGNHLVREALRLGGKIIDAEET